MCLDQHWSVHWYLLQGTFALFVPCFSLWVTTTNHHSKHWKHNHQPSNILPQCNEAQAMWQPENVTLWQSDFLTSSIFVKKSMLSFENFNRKRSNRKCDTLRKCTAGLPSVESDSNSWQKYKYRTKYKYMWQIDNYVTNSVLCTVRKHLKLDDPFRKAISNAIQIGWYKTNLANSDIIFCCHP